MMEAKGAGTPGSSLEGGGRKNMEEIVGKRESAVELRRYTREDTHLT